MMKKVLVASLLLTSIAHADEGLDQKDLRKKQQRTGTSFARFVVAAGPWVASAVLSYQLYLLKTQAREWRTAFDQEKNTLYAGAMAIQTEIDGLHEEVARIRQPAAGALADAPASVVQASATTVSATQVIVVGSSTGSSPVEVSPGNSDAD